MSTAINLDLHRQNPWEGKVSDPAAKVLQKYVVYQKMPTEDLPNAIKKEVWVASWALGYEQLRESLFTKAEIRSNEFGPVIRKLTHWLDIEKDREKIFKVLTHLTKVEKCTGSIWVYRVTYWNYSFLNAVTCELCRNNTKMQRLIGEWEKVIHDPESPYFVGGHKEQKITSVKELEWHEAETLRIKIMSASKSLSEEHNVIFFNTYQEKISDQTAKILKNYVLDDKLPPSHLQDEEKQELWVAAWLRGQCHLMRHLYDYREMDKPEFGVVLEKFFDWIGDDVSKDRAIISLLALAQAHESLFDPRSQSWKIGGLFHEFLKIHEKSLGGLFAIWWRNCYQTIEIVTPISSFTVDEFNAKSLFDPNKSVKPSDLDPFFKVVDLANYGFSIHLEHLKSFSTMPEVAEERIKKYGLALTQEEAKYLEAITDSTSYNGVTIKPILRAPKGTLHRILKLVDKLGRDKLPDLLKKNL